MTSINVLGINGCTERSANAQAAPTAAWARRNCVNLFGKGNPRACRLNRGWIFLLLASMIGFASIARAATGDLLAQGAGDRGLWLAQVVPEAENAKTVVTLIRFRGNTSDKWEDIAQLSGRIGSMAAHGTQLAVLQDNGDWLLVWDDGSALGQPIPMQGKIRALAGDGDTLWAVALVTGERPATQPTTGPSTQPTTQSAAATLPAVEATSKPTPFKPRWTLFRLDVGGWKSVGDMDAPIESSVTVAAARGGAVTAFKNSNGHVVVYLNGSRIKDVPNVEASQFPILIDDARSMLWAANEGNPGTIIGLSDGAPAGSLAQPKGMTANADRAIAVSTGRLRLLFTKTEQGKTSILEQKYDLKTLKPIDDPAVLMFPVPNADSTYATVFRAIVLATLVFSVMASFQRRNAVQALLAKPDYPEPAPLAARLMAGAIDLLPLLVGFAVMKWLSPSTNDPTMVMDDPLIDLIAGVSMLVYLLHTTVIEMIFGRSIGKMIFRLNIIGLDGEPAKAGALLLRNLLRVVDLALFGLMIFSPLRQRIGDIVGGTLVVSNREKTDTDR